MPIMAVAVLGLLSIFLSYKTAHGGLMSFLSGILGNEQASAETSYLDNSLLNSQTMALLQAPASPSQPASSSDELNPPIEGGTALSPDIAAANSVSDSEPTNTQISTYTVRQGDTVYGVAKMFNVSVNTVLWANNLTTRSILHEGDILVILPVTGINYTVQAGDTIQGIAKKYGADVNDILNYNDLSLSSILQRGIQIIIPDAEMSSPSAPQPSKRSVGFEPLLDGWGWPSAGLGYYTCPVPGARLSQGLHGHNAVDLAISKGTPIRAAADGTVIISRSNGAWNGGYGNFVVILHGNGTQTLYAHMLRSTVYAGEEVSRGETIGYVGMTGLTTGPHVHFEIRGAQNPFTNPALCF